MAIDLDDDEAWLRVGKGKSETRSPNAKFKTSRLFAHSTAYRGKGAWAGVQPNSPMALSFFGFKNRAGEGADSRTKHRASLRWQATYIGIDAPGIAAETFDKDGPVEKIWDRVEDWENDRRYFRGHINPLDHDKIQDWHRYVREIMDVFQHGTHRVFGEDRESLQWHAPGILTDEDRAAGKSLDWVAGIHRETGRTHAHILVRGMLGHEDLHIEPEGMKSLGNIARGVASMEHHIGLHRQYDPHVEASFEKVVQRDARLDQRAMKKSMVHDPEME